MGADLKFVFRNFPLGELHRHAIAAAMAAEAAALQNKFWEMHDIIYEAQQRLQANDLLAYANKIGLDLKKFSYDTQLESLRRKIDDDLESGIWSGVNGTPSFFINGKKWNGIWEDKAHLLQYLQQQV